MLEYYSSRHAAAEQLRERRMDAVARILRRHKIAMHWELLAAIVISGEDGLFLSERAVLATLAHNPDWFLEESPGCYRLLPRRM